MFEVRDELMQQFETWVVLTSGSSQSIPEINRRCFANAELKCQMDVKGSVEDELSILSMMRETCEWRF